MTKRGAHAVLALGLLLATACRSAPGYAEFFRDVSGWSWERKNAIRAGPTWDYWGVEPASRSDVSDDPAEVILRYERLGFMLIGYSGVTTTGAPPAQDDATRQGQEAGADLVVLLAPKSHGLTTVYVPLSGYTSSTTWAGVNATAQVGLGTATATGTGVSTSVGSSTTYVPVARDRIAYTALYFLKPRLTWGVFVRDLTDDERRSLGTNRGAVVRSVVNDSPAFLADLLPGDVVLSINEKPVSSAETMMQVQFAKLEWPVEYKLVVSRDGVRIEKTIKVN